MLFFPLLILISSCFWSWRFLDEKLLSPSTCALHTAQAFVVLAVAVVGLRIARPERRSTKFAWHGFWLAITAFWNVAALGNFTSRSQWGDPLSLAWLRKLVVEDPSLRATFLDLLRPNVLIKIAGLTLVFWMVFVLHSRVSRSTLGIRVGGAFRRGAWLFLTFAGLATLAIDFRVPTARADEPLSVFLRGSAAFSDLDGGLDPYRRVAARLDEEIRRDYDPGAIRPTTNVVLIMADSLRADRLPFYGYSRNTAPFMQSLVDRRELKRVEWAFSTCSESACGIMSTLTGHPFQRVSHDSLKLYELLDRANYATELILVGDHVEFFNLGSFYGSKAKRAETVQGLSPADDRLALEYISRLAPFDGQPRFLFFFLMSTHIYGPRWPDFDIDQPSDVSGLKQAWNRRKLPASELAAHGEAMSNNYDNGVRQFDAVVESIFTGLRDKGYLNDALVIVTSDHGEALGEHSHRGHTFYLYNEEIRIPLLLWDSHATTPGPDFEVASHIDLAPTIFDRVGLPIPATWSGRPIGQASLPHLSVHMTRRGREPCAAAVFFQPSHRLKLIICRKRKGIEELLFDLNHDPQELTNLLGGPLSAEQSESVALMRERLSFFYGEIIKPANAAIQ
jgi:Sulfatase